MTTMKRYCLQKLITRDSKNKLETWKNTNLKSNNVEVFSNFNTASYRIFDTMENKIIPFTNKF